MEVALTDYQGFHERMSGLREKEIGLDGGIRSRDGGVRVHFPYMAACNQTLYHRITAVIQQGNSELRSNASLQGIQLLVDYCYSGKMTITEENFRYVIDAALSLEFLDITEGCVQFALQSGGNANIWCHFFKVAFKHPCTYQREAFVPNLILRNIIDIPKEGIVQGLDTAYISEILKHGSLANESRGYALSLFLDMFVTSKVDISVHKETICVMADLMSHTDKLEVADAVDDVRVTSLLELALQLQFPALVDACRERLERAPPTTSVISRVLSLLTQYAGTEAVVYLDSYVNHAFTNIPLDIPEAELYSLLQSDSLSKVPELEIFHTALKWINHNNCNENTRKKIVSLIRFGLMTEKDVHQIVKNHTLPGCGELLISTMQYHFNIYDQPLTKGNMNKLRLSRASIYLLGGEDVDGNCHKRVLRSEVSREMEQSLSPFTEQCDMPFTIKNSACAELNGFIFVCGGDGPGECVDATFRLDTRNNSWLELACLQERKRDLSLTVVDKSIVAVGGYNRNNHLSTVEVYDVRLNTWTRTEPLPQPRNQHAACYMDRKLYISGGTKSKTLFCQAGGMWTEKAPMLHVRQCHGMVGVGDQLIVAGGLEWRDENWHKVMSTECYDLVQDQWTKLSPPLHAFHLGCTLRINHLLYYFGGFAYNTSKSSDIIQIYNIETDEWKIIERKINNPICRMVGACILLE